MTLLESSEVLSAVRNCPACECAASTEVGAKDGYLFYRCGGCHSLFTGALPTPDCLGRFYDGYYEAHNLTAPAFIQAQLDKIIAAFTPHRVHNRLLDVGCGAGGLLEAAGRRGWQTFGTEVSESACRHLAAAGANIFLGALAEAQYPADHFDVVTCSEVLEHVTDPEPLVREVARVLRPGGVFWLTTPHAWGLSARSLGLRWSVVCPPEHLQLFSVRGIRRLLGRVGFCRVRVAARGCNVVEIAHRLRQGVKRRPTGAGQPAAQATPAVGEPTFDRVHTSYRLNQLFLSNPVSRMTKAALNGLLNLTGQGDGLRVLATWKGSE